VTERLVLGPDHEVLLEPVADTWAVTPRRMEPQSSGVGEGAAQALLGLLHADEDLTDRWQVLRLAPAPEVSGERPILVDQTNTSVIVGERIVVKWMRSLSDRPQPSLAALAQLHAVEFDRMPTPFAVLTWTSPTGRALPVAYVTEYVDGAADGWIWCADLVRAALTGNEADPWTRDFPRRLGTLTADLHVALATPSHVFPHPVQVAGVARVHHWYDGALAMLEQALTVSDPEVTEVVRRRAEQIVQQWDRSLGDNRRASGTAVQHIHGDLHVGQVLRSGDNLAVTDFDGNPVAPATEMVQPAARDVAQLVCSLRHLGPVVLRRTPELDTRAAQEWISLARNDFLTAYRSGLHDRTMSYVFDEDLLAAFELEQELRELVYADVHLPRWSYAPLQTLESMLERGER
jgi:maltokinase